VRASYPGPLRDEPLAIELHNTLYAANGTVIDGLAEGGSAAAWLDAIATRVLAGGAARRPAPSREDLVALRTAVRDALTASLSGDRVPRPTLDAINAFSALAPQSPAAVWQPRGAPVAGTDVHGATRADVILASLAGDAIELLTGPRRAGLRACGAPGCVLMFLKDHPRREWCCNACGNRARQARHYQRSRRDS
jgi:predicted RNA-binding Zn ribbon-like protein